MRGRGENGWGGDVVESIEESLIYRIGGQHQ